MAILTGFFGEVWKFFTLRVRLYLHGATQQSHGISPLWVTAELHDGQGCISVPWCVERLRLSVIAQFTHSPGVISENPEEHSGGWES